MLDGAMGTELIAREAEVEKCNDYLNIDSGDVVIDVHKSYLQAGSDAVLTNTFGANEYTLGRHGLADKVEEINRGLIGSFVGVGITYDIINDTIMVLSECQVHLLSRRRGL